MDDAEYGIGGILIQAVRAGHRVVVVTTVSDYTTWESTIGREEQCKKDQLALAERFGYEKRFLDYPYHQFPADNAAKGRLAEIYVELQPNITFVHNTKDHFPDHVGSGIAAKDAVLFAHGYTEVRSIRRCPRVFAYNLTPKQTIRFEPDYFVDIDDAMPEYVELLQGTDSCLTGRPPQELICREIADTRTGAVLRVSGHGWLRLAECAVWGNQNGTSTYAIGLETLWGPRDGRPLW
jgi:LmbE family N-acetylglucosaminyl deacetylase